MNNAIEISKPLLAFHPELQVSLGLNDVILQSADGHHFYFDGRVLATLSSLFAILTELGFASDPSCSQSIDLSIDKRAISLPSASSSGLCLALRIIQATLAGQTLPVDDASMLKWNDGQVREMRKEAC